MTASIYVRSLPETATAAGVPETLTVTRQLAAILAADVVGYSRLMGQDEVGTRLGFGPNIANSSNHRSRNTSVASSKRPAMSSSLNSQASLMPLRVPLR